MVDQSYLNRYKTCITNSIQNTNYITKQRLEGFLKRFKYVEEDEFDCKEVALEALSSDTLDTIKNFQEYEFDKSYKYFTVYEVKSEVILSKIGDMSDRINNDELDYLSATISKPTIKHYENEVDIKFSLLLGSESNAIKYPIIVTLFKNLDLLSIKYCSVTEEFYEKEFYIDINNRCKYWIENTFNVQLIEFKSQEVFEKLQYSIRMKPDEHSNESIHSILRDDEMNGRTYFRASDLDTLPLIDELLKISDTFENENDKKKVQAYIQRYEKESIVRSVAIKWKKRFMNSKGKMGYITVSISKVYSVNNENKFKYEFILHHIHQNGGINRERINYVIQFISDYLDKSNEESSDK